MKYILDDNCVGLWYKHCLPFDKNPRLITGITSTVDYNVDTIINEDTSFTHADWIQEIYHYDIRHTDIMKLIRE